MAMMYIATISPQSSPKGRARRRYPTRSHHFGAPSAPCRARPGPDRARARTRADDRPRPGPHHLHPADPRDPKAIPTARGVSDRRDRLRRAGRGHADRDPALDRGRGVPGGNRRDAARRPRAGRQADPVARLLRRRARPGAGRSRRTAERLGPMAMRGCADIPSRFDGFDPVEPPGIRPRQNPDGVPEDPPDPVENVRGYGGVGIKRRAPPAATVPAGATVRPPPTAPPPAVVAPRRRAVR
ncbi:hypothetical protein EHYA_04350 [Embleya hyalina]|uniref:Uncharacterized protein n=1 Tax=Embleya hyalina TaxID=516124 RepID=A0A401YPZ1_9ACTN|nr:hypothetical protein EHYA_04350 [Embleya hyalina]